MPPELLEDDDDTALDSELYDGGEDDEQDEDTFVDEELPPDEPVSGEARARAQGWKPLAEYRGDPRRWVDWPEFLRKGEEELPVMRDQNRRLSEKVARLEQQLTTQAAENREAIQAAMNLARRADDAGYQRGLAELRAKQKAAVREADEDEFDSLQAQIDAMEEERAKQPTPAAVPATPAQPPQDPAIAAFIAANPWYNAKPHLRQPMIAMHQAVMAESPTLSLAEQLDLARERMAAAFPEIDDAMARQPAPRPTPPAPPRRPAPVLPPSGDASQRPPRRSADPFDQIPAEERADARKAFASIQRGDPTARAAEYVAIYLNPHADVLALRRQRKA